MKMVSNNRTLRRKVDISEFVSTEHKLRWENKLVTKLKDVEERM